MRTSRSAILAGLLTLGAALAPPSANAGAESPRVDHSAFDALLQRHVADTGVRYADWAASEADRAALTSYLADLAATPASLLPRDERLAYWINLYNALTLDLVLDAYPVESIKKVPGRGSPWKRELVTVEGRELTLNEIENDVVRPEFDEPRIHFALNCAAVSCPPLRAGAYVADRLDEQLDEQTRSFLGDPSQNGLDEKGRLRLSKILDWYRSDFERDGDLVDWVRPYVPALAALPAGSDVDVKYRGYDWALNEARP